MDRVRRVSNQLEFERSIDEFITRGYTLLSKEEKTAHLREEDWGATEIHVLIAGISIWWTFGLANALYAIYSRLNAEEIVIRVEKDDGKYDNNNNTNSKARSDLVNKQLYHGNEESRLGFSQIGFEESRQNIQGINQSLIASIFRFGLQTFSLLVAGFVMIVVFTTYNKNNIQLVGLTIVTLTASLAFRYSAVYHRFKKLSYKVITLLLTFSIFTLTGGLTIKNFIESTDTSQILLIYQSGFLDFRPDILLPKRWLAIILTVGGILIFIGAVIIRDFKPYRKPIEFREIPLSPVYFGFVCSVLGLWAVLFVGFNVQRIIVIAPIFEEILKFGVALLISSVLFGRSTLTRIATAIIVGSLFGFIEHLFSYPSESNWVYLFRVLFHMSTTVLSISLYTVFESNEDNKLLAISPIYSMMIHFFYNTFVTLWSVISVLLIGISSNGPTLIYGGLAIILSTIIFIISMTSYRLIRSFHLPIKKVISNIY